MPQTTPATYPLAKPHASRHWQPARVARRLVERHGFPEARRRALVQKSIHGRALNQGCRSERTPFLIIYWDIVAVATGKVPEPVRHILARTAA